MVHAMARRFDAPLSTGSRHGFPTPGPQSPTGADVMQDVYFLTEAQWQQVGDKVYDFVIIGTSFCALSFATKALERNRNCKILFLERGTFFLPTHFQNLPSAFTDTLGGKSETFPWTVDRRTESGDDGCVTWSHGSVPFFGGRSTVWSAWCPRPNENEMKDWPSDVIAAAQRNFQFAEELIRVQSADMIDRDVRQVAAYNQRPVYGLVQARVQALLQDAADELRAFGIDRIEAARLASADSAVSGVDFLKFSVPGSLLQLKRDHPHVDIKLNCVVRKILNQQGVATALDTSCGFLPLNGAPLVLAMGALPATTLVRNSFSGLLNRAGARFSAHFITSIVARVPRCSLLGNELPNQQGFHEVGACYISGVADSSYAQQFHIQLSMVTDQQPEQHASQLLRYMPDVVATASRKQMETSRDYVVLVCAVLGELDVGNPDNGFTHNPADEDLTTNSLLRVVSKSPQDLATWDAMDEATFAVLRQIGKEGGVEYWHGTPDEGQWLTEVPNVKHRRVPALVHESSTLHIGDDKDAGAVVDLRYKLKDTENVYVTGGGLWPRGGSWNPTLTMSALAADLAEKLQAPK